MYPPTVYQIPPITKTTIPPIPIIGISHKDKKAPNHPIVMYMVMDIHLGNRSIPNFAVRYIPSIDRNHATPKKDQPMAEWFRNTRHNGVNVPAMRG
mmetsp:Transcript_9161/g.19550  ORF Transcript_9161/g.19550 Transcript_9161/m.19550 type:complete len:96 (-) Transcript_9161:445-732(-)